MGTIFNIQRYCLHDGDGIRTTVFFKGCPLRCIWCHNPEGLSTSVSVSYNEEKCTLCGRCTDVCPGREIVNGLMVFDRSKCTRCGKCYESCLCGANELLGKDVTVDEVISEVLKDKIYYKTSGGGMTLSGGEPSMQPEFALELIERSVKEGISVSIETCGIGSRDFYRAALSHGATFLFDIKIMDPARHKTLTGVDNAHILDNLCYLLNNDADVMIRLPLIPSVNDSDEDIKELCEFLNRYKGKYRYAEVMPYHSFGVAKAKHLGNDGVFQEKDASDEDKKRWIALFNKYGTDVKLS